ncbi:MAG: hypothetical protein HYX34_10620 [Actinobacteria bacterium]|nr:hypothetical protein [Actinomycetota bacterium]
MIGGPSTTGNPGGAARDERDARDDGDDGGAGALLLPPELLHPIEEPFDVEPLAAPRVSPGFVARLGAPPGGNGTSGAPRPATALHAAALLDAVFGAVALLDGHDLAGVVVGRRCLAPAGLDLGLTGVLFDIDGVQVGTAAGAASAGGHPAAAVAQAVTAAERRGDRVTPASAVWCGPLLDPVALPPGARSVRASFAHLGDVPLRVRR